MELHERRSATATKTELLCLLKARLFWTTVDSTGKNDVLASNNAGFRAPKTAKKAWIIDGAKLRVIRIKTQLVDCHLGELFLLLIWI